MGAERVGEQDGRGTSVLRNGIRVLAAFSVEEPVLGVTEIARQVELHKSTVSRILATLELDELVERDADTGRFRLGLGVIGLAGPLLANLDVRRVAYPALQDLTHRTGETSALMVWNGHESVVAEQVASPKHVKHTAAIGTRYDTVASSSVRVFLAEIAEPETDRMLQRGLFRAGADDQSRSRIQHRLREVRDAGYAINDGETSVEEVGICAPVRDHRDLAVAAVLLSAPRFRTSSQLLHPLAETVRDVAREVSARLGTPARRRNPH
ncbi:MAG: IclR family transcriptional regulator [Sciscionella sp.]